MMKLTPQRKTAPVRYRRRPLVLGTTAVDIGTGLYDRPIQHDLNGGMPRQEGPGAAPGQMSNS